MKLIILGASGSIGLQTLDIVREHKNFDVLGVSVYSQIDTLHKIIDEFHPLYVTIGKEEDVETLQKRYPELIIYAGNEGLSQLVEVPSDEEVLVVNGLVGSVGLAPTIHAIKASRNIALANKETLVIGGEIIKPLLEEYKVSLIPIDSEHSSIFQCIKGEEKAVENIIITASGGSFRDKSRKELEGVSVKEALSHPNWSMGAKITIDSATMMNKGLEIIEAHYLFDINYDSIKTVLHRESIVHSLVEFNDQSMLAHLGEPDMRVPINYAINYPNRVPYKGKRLELETIGSLHFEPLSKERYPMLQYAIEAGKKKGLAPCTLNAANEQAVTLFLDGKIEFLMIEEIVKHCLEHFNHQEKITLESLLQHDKDVKEYVIKKFS